MNIEDQYLLEQEFLLQKARESSHSRDRKNDRSISPIMEQIMQCFGQIIPGKGDSQIIELPRDFLRQAQKAFGCRQIVKNGTEITWEWKTTRTQKRMKSENRPMSSRPDKHKMED